MPKIITVTFNPAIDKSTTVPVLMPEKKLRCGDPVFEPGGGGINVARAIKKLGGEATAFYLAGGYAGQAFVDLLKAEGVESVVTPIAGNTRENFIVLESASGQQYRFGMPGPEISETEWRDCLNGLELAKDADIIVVSGSLPKGVPDDVYLMIGAIAQRNKARLIIDTSGDALKKTVQAGVYLLKPNLGELASLVEKDDLDIELVDDAAREVIRSGHCEVMVVSMGAAGAMVVTKDIAEHIFPPAVKIKSTVGAGDSMVAGMVWSIAQNRSIQDAVRYGVACGTAATMNEGTALCRKKDADHLFTLMKSRNVL
ncbi:1-phosphofructokinase family hexose kinase [Parasegetibacter sp. NRK P23]|uniref:1-phosphofructokinase family hexose kinase n=1 Tax=Parasegetibacter sp. NRK P23 TaxID=2942999 RepID=UPI0020436D03|nr:1-phosphofructokinase family hexose kinase [Parasegetibacter sp. NRK P23]MCM5528651.1 1-phosphofructokinase family hexose kinase [Parasegetibacter sp. NRK P23]